MTDFFADLESHLLDATERENERRRRFRLPSLRPAPAIAFACTLALIVGIVALATSGNDERAASPQQQDEGWTSYPAAKACSTDGPAPDALIDGLAVFRREQKPSDELTPQMRSGLASQGVEQYWPQLARGSAEAGVRYWVVPACAGPEELTLCLLAEPETITCHRAEKPEEILISAVLPDRVFYVKGDAVKGIWISDRDGGGGFGGSTPGNLGSDPLPAVMKGKDVVVRRL